MLLSEGMLRGAAAKCLCRAYAAGAPPHAALVLGEEGTGKRTLLNACAQSLFCEAKDKPCGACAPCRRFAARSHPDVHRIERKKSVGVDEVRDLTAALQIAPYEGGYKTAIIEDAGAMTPQAQNCLLKTLEEPPEKTVFLLAAASESKLLSTILSRCMIVRLSPFSEQKVCDILRAQGAPAERAAQLAALSGGSVGKALSMLHDESFWQLRTRVDGAMVSVRGAATVLGALNALKDDKAEAAAVCDLLESTLSEALRRTAGTGYQDASGWAAALARADRASLARLLSDVASLRRMLAANVPWHAALERFLFRYSEEQKKWQS